MKRLSSRLRSVLSGVRKRLRSQNDTKAGKESPSNLEREQPLPSPPVDNWVKQSRFRSPIRLSGSSVIYIWFESLQETGVRFSLDMATGILSHRENWSPDIKMPGADAIDPEPLSVWGIDSADGRINIIMHVDR
ncbi:MAG: hypothetical protein VX278_21085, partial [Myxococcota bacterium]|nr:hypothetical protein [Myxococcota bacterium]